MTEFRNLNYFSVGKWPFYGEQKHQRGLHVQ